MVRLKREESFGLKCVEQCDSTDDYRPTVCPRHPRLACLRVEDLSRSGQTVRIPAFTDRIEVLICA